MRKLFCYAIPSTVFVANTIVQPQINISSEHDFELAEIRATQQAAGAILMQLSVASGDLFSNVPLDTLQFAGTSLGYKLPIPVNFPANTQLNVQIKNTTGGNLTSQIQFWGYKVDRK
jgi:hypothetical protein